MMILVSKLFRTPVVAIGQGKVGELKDPIINIENGQLLAFYVQESQFFAPKKVISLIDIIVLDPKVIIINSSESVIKPDEVVRIKESLDKKFTLMKAKAYTQSKSYLGRIEDAVIDTEANAITKYYIKHYLQNRILPAEKIIEIKKNTIIFDDSVNTPNTTAGGVPV